MKILSRNTVGRQSADRGFTLVEMMIVVAIIGIASALAAPNLTAWIARTQLREAISEVQHQLALARMTAMSRNIPVTVTLSLANGSMVISTANAATNVVLSTTRTMDTPKVVTLNVGPSPGWTPVATTTVSFNSMGMRTGGPGRGELGPPGAQRHRRQPHRELQGRRPHLPNRAPAHLLHRQ